MPTVQCTTGHQNVILGASWVVGVFLLKMMRVSRTCRWKKLTRIAVLVVARPRHPSTGKFRGPPEVGKAMRRYVAPRQGPWFTNYVSHPLPSCASSADGPPATQAPSSPRTLCTYLNPLPLLVGRLRSHHPSPVRRLQLCSCCLAQSEDHSDCLPDVVIQAHSFEINVY